MPVHLRPGIAHIVHLQRNDLPPEGLAEEAVFLIIIAVDHIAHGRIGGDGLLNDLTDRQGAACLESDHLQTVVDKDRTSMTQICIPRGRRCSGNKWSRNGRGWVWRGYKARH